MSDENKYNLDLSQKSGIGSSGAQKQHIQIGDHYHGDVFKKLVSIHNGNLTFDPNALKEIIVEIDAGIESIQDEAIDFSLGIDMKEKNKLNNHSDEFFSEFVEIDFYPQFHKIDQFLGLKENQQSLQKKVDHIIKSLNRKITLYQGDMRFEEVLSKITDKLIDVNHDTLKDKEDLILLTLYYFYCNCCIGIKVKNDADAK